MSYQPRSEFLRVMQERGFLADCTDLEGLDEALLAGPLTAYIGYDCTGPSLHAGHMTNIMMLRWFQKCGHRPIVLMGGGTTKIGDPSGKDESRRLLTEDTIAANMASIRGVFTRFLDFAEAGGNAVMRNNADWLDGLGYIAFLRDYGRHFTVNRMLGFESVKARLEREQPLTFLEFNYMLLQAYDFLELYRREGCRLQMGGSDQWGNIVNGVDLTRRIEGVEVFGLTCPLLTTAAGAKMGKTAQGAIWLNADMLGPWEFWQYWRNTADADVGRFLGFFTELPMEEVRRLGALEGAEINAAKEVLANAVTALVHGQDAAEAAARTAAETFGAGGAGEALPTVTLSQADFAEGGVSVVQLFVRAGLAGSGKEAKRLIGEGAARIDDEPVGDPGLRLPAARFAGAVKLSAGKKRHALARLG